MSSVWARRAGMVAVLVALAAGTLAWTALTHAHPSFDAYGWLTWGRQTLSANLNTGAAPSWKPLPYIFTLPFALFGNTQLWLWTYAASVLGLSGAIFAYRAAARLASPAGDQPAWLQWPVIVAGLLGAVAYLSIYGLWRQLLITDSDPIVISACLAAVDLHLARRPLGCLGALVVAALGRPEAWPTLVLYALWLCLRPPQGRARSLVRGLVGFSALLVPAAWFVIPGLTSKSPFQAGNAAIGFHTAILHGNRVRVVLDRFWSLYDALIWATVIATFLYALWRRLGVWLCLFGLSVLWVATEIAFAYHDWPAAPRYLMEPAAVLGVLSAAAFGRLARAGAAWLIRGGWKLRTGGLLGVAVCVAVVAALVPFGIGRVGALSYDTGHEVAVGRQMAGLTAAIRGVGGYQRIDRCAAALTPVGDESAVAWNLHLSVGDIAHRPGIQLSRGVQAVFIRPHGHGPLPATWKITTVNLTRAQLQHCGGIPVDPVPTDPAARARLFQREHDHGLSRRDHRPTPGGRNRRSGSGRRDHRGVVTV